MKTLGDDLQRFADYWKQGDSPVYLRYREFVESTQECCERSHLEGHCTGSALVVCPKFERVLLLFHPFLQRWLQPGGHADGDPDLLQVALKEAFEETGIPMENLHPVPLGGKLRVPLDLDIHPIPSRHREPAHFHYDMRFLIQADPSIPIIPESQDLQVEWMSLNQVADKTDEESVLRMVRKVESLRVLLSA